MGVESVDNSTLYAPVVFTFVSRSGVGLDAEEYFGISYAYEAMWRD